MESEKMNLKDLYHITDIKVMSQAVEQSPASVVITDLNGNIEYVNRKFCDVTKFRPEEIIGKNPRILKSGAQDDSYYKQLWLTITAGKTWYGELKNKKKNGEYYWESASISPIKDENNRITHFLGIKEDITDKKNQELALLESEKRLRLLLQKEEEQNKKLKNFAHILAHNIQSQTANLEGLLYLIQIEDPSFFQNTYVSTISEISKKMKETTLILNDTVSPNRNPEIEKEKINLNKSIFDVLQTLNPPIQKSKIEVINTVPFDFIICGIRKYIDSILMNLISNSIQFLSQDRPPKIHISAERQDEYSVFIVEDNGLGMDIKKHGDRIFEMYKTFHSQNQSKGLGFFVIKNHVDEMGGKIEIESDLDQGMKVKVYLTNE